MTRPSHLPRSALLAAWLLCLAAPAGAQAPGTLSPAQRLQGAVTRFEAGQPLETIADLEGLLRDGGLTAAQRSQARKYVALGYLLRDETTAAVAVFKDLVGEDPSFTMRDLALSYESAPGDYAVRFFAQATLEWRQEQLARQRARLEQTSRTGAMSRSLLLPGLGQRYQGYRGRSWALLGLTGASVVYAAAADRSYRDARDAYDGAQAGDDFERLWRDYTDQADAADLALAVVGAVWALNLLDAALSGPNLSGLESVHLAPARTSDGAAHVALRLEF